MVSANERLKERLEALEDEVDLLKTEIRQTLIDMREALLQRNDILPLPRDVSSPAPVVSAEPASSLPAEVPAPSAEVPVVAAPTSMDVPASGLDPSLSRGNNPIINDILEWMGSAKEKGITAARLFPILEAYETSGMMTPLMAKFLMKSMSMLDEIEIGDNGKTISPSEYSATLSELHKLVCISIDSSN